MFTPLTYAERRARAYGAVMLRLFDERLRLPMLIIISPRCCCRLRQRRCPRRQRDAIDYDMR